jgi:hypothetical protein
MMRKLELLPELLQKQVFIRLGTGILLVMAIMAISLSVKDIYLILPCAAIAIFYITHSFILYKHIASGGYVIINGKCIKVGYGLKSRRPKFIVVSTEAGNIKVILKSKNIKIDAGSQIKLYVLKETKIYEQNDTQILYNFLGIEAKQL